MPYLKASTFVAELRRKSDPSPPNSVLVADPHIRLCLLLFACRRGPPTFLRLARGTALAITTEEYIESARSLGCSPVRVAVRHVLPNILPPLLIQSSLTAAAAIIAEASLSFLGLGQQPPAPSWGSMLNAAQRYLVQAPWMAIYPGLMIFGVVMSLNVVGDALRDALDPKHQ